MYNITIVGLGAAGIFTLALLPDILYKDVLVLEPAAVGGELGTHYGAVVANITKKEISDAIHSVPRWSHIHLSELMRYPDDICPLLADVMRQLRALIAPELAKINLRARRAVTYKKAAAGHWAITADDGSLFETQKIVLCTGATPKCYDIPVPSIPLHIALTPQALVGYLQPPARVLVFGTSHSGTLVLKNLKELRIHDVTAYYTGSTPFLYARDGHTEGLKQESASIADEIRCGAWNECTPTLAPFTGFTNLELTSNTYVVYACGFERRPFVYENAEGEKQTANHDGTWFIGSDGKGVKDVYGFGIGYPSFYTAPSGTKYPDVGFAGFIGAIKVLLPHLTKPWYVIPGPAPAMP